jgi:hypothetical protein
MAEARATSLRLALSSHERGRGNRYPSPLRARVVAFAQARRGEGATWVQIAAELGLELETVRRWCLKSNDAVAAPAILPVEIVADSGAAAGLSIVSPSGVRVEGVTLAEVIAVLRAVG